MTRASDRRCTQVMDLMTRFVRGELVGDEEHMVWDHIDHCEACLGDYRQSLFLTPFLEENVAPVDPPADLARNAIDSIRKRFDQLGKRKRTPIKSH